MKLLVLLSKNALNLEISSKRSYMKRLKMEYIILYKNLASWSKLIYTKNIKSYKTRRKRCQK